VLGGGALLAGDPQHHDSLAQQQLGGQPGIPDRRPDVAVQQPLELVPVAALEDDFAKLQQHARLAGSLPRRPGHRDGIGDGHPSSLPALTAADACLAAEEQRHYPERTRLTPRPTLLRGVGGT